MDMGTLIAILAVAVAAAIGAVFLKDSRLPVLSLLTALAAGAMILVRLLPFLSGLWRQAAALGEQTGVNGYYLSIVLKIIAVAYVAEFGAQLCRDAGQGALGFKVELAAKLFVLALAFPIISAVVRSVLSLLS